MIWNGLGNKPEQPVRPSGELVQLAVDHADIAMRSFAHLHGIGLQYDPASIIAEQPAMERPLQAASHLINVASSEAAPLVEAKPIENTVANPVEQPLPSENDPLAQARQAVNQAQPTAALNLDNFQKHWM